MKPIRILIIALFGVILLWQKWGQSPSKAYVPHLAPIYEKLEFVEIDPVANMNQPAVRDLALENPI